MFKKKFISQKVLIVKEAQNGPLDSSSPKNWPGGQQDQGRGVVLTFNHEGVLWQKSTTSKNVFGKYPSSKKIDQVDSNNNNLVESNMITDKVINDLWLLNLLKSNNKRLHVCMYVCVSAC